MSRAAPIVAVSPKMLRHFATVTVAITFCVAIFADGEGREAIQEQLAAREARTNMLHAEADKLGNRRVDVHNLKRQAERHRTMSSSADASESSGGYGAPMDNAAGSDAESATESGRLPADPREGGRPQFGPPQQSGQPPFADPNMGPQGQPNRNPGARRQPQRPTAEQRERLIEASRARSGSSG